MLSHPLKRPPCPLPKRNWKSFPMLPWIPTRFPKGVPKREVLSHPRKRSPRQVPNFLHLPNPRLLLPRKAWRPLINFLRKQETPPMNAKRKQILLFRLSTMTLTILSPLHR
ncbi:uncharacterized protein METZ01_LOCUS381804, partial [marine metagenome]